MNLRRIMSNNESSLYLQYNMPSLTNVKDLNIKVSNFEHICDIKTFRFDKIFLHIIKNYKYAWLISIKSRSAYRRTLINYSV
jgi:hypothetical protein